MALSEAYVEYKLIRVSSLAMATAFTLQATISANFFIFDCTEEENEYVRNKSDDADKTPKSGLCTILLIVSTVIAFTFLHALHLGIQQLQKGVRHPWLRLQASFLSKVYFMAGHLCILGMVIIIAFPKDTFKCSEEVGNVIKHLPEIGTFAIISGSVFYCISITYIMSLLQPQQKNLIRIRIFLICIMNICYASILVNFLDLVELENTAILNKLPTEALKNTIASNRMVKAVSECLLLATVTLFILSQKEDTKSLVFKVTVTLREERNSTVHYMSQEDEVRKLNKITTNSNGIEAKKQ